MYGSEFCAQSLGAMNYYVNNGNKQIRPYIVKSEWSDFELSSEINTDDNLYNIDNKNYDNYDNYEIIETDFIYPSDDITNCNIINYNIPYGYFMLSNLVMRIKRSELGDKNVLNTLKHVKLELNIGGTTITKMYFMTNLFIAKMLNRNIKEYDDIIEIPLTLFNMNKYDKRFESKLPICLIKYNDVCVKIYGIDKHISIGLKYRQYESTLQTNTHCELFIIQIQEIRFILCEQERYKLNFRHPCKIIIIRLFNTINNIHDTSINDLDGDKIKTIGLSLNMFEPITWNNDDGEIMKYRIGNDMFYAISLSPEFKSSKHIKKMFKSTETCIGIDFSRQDRAHLIIDFYENNLSYEYVQISTMNVNIIRYMTDMCGIVYV